MKEKIYKLKKEDIDAEITNKGFIPLDYDFKGIDTTIIFKDNEGYKYSYGLYSFRYSKAFKPIIRTNPFAIYNIKLYILNNNLDTELLSDTFYNVTTPLLFRCKRCGGIFSISWVKLLARKYLICNNCIQNNGIPSNRKLTNDRVIAILDKYGYTALDITQYKGTDKYLDIIDKDGYKYQSKLGNIQSNKIPRKVISTNKFAIQNIQRFLDIHNTNTIVLDTEYKSDTTMLSFKCGKCGKVFKKSWGTINNKKSFYCIECSTAIRGKKRRASLKDVREKFAKHGLTLIDENYTGNANRLLCKDADGYLGYYSYNHLLRSQNTANKRPNLILFSIKYNEENFLYNLNNFIRTNDITCEVCSYKENGRFNTTELLCKCECGEFFTTSLSSFISKIKVRCDKCTKSISSYELLVKEYLDELNVDYIQQYRNTNCRNILPLPFDFYLQKSNILVEVDGEGHYYPCHFNNCTGKDSIEAFERTKHNDKIKNEWCVHNNVSLLRIPYWDIKNKKYKTTINKIINSNNK